MSEAPAIATNHPVVGNGNPSNGGGNKEPETRQEKEVVNKGSGGRKAKKGAMTWTRTRSSETKKVSKWTERTNFLADSPYFRTFVQKEMYGLDSASESLRDLATRVEAFKKQGAVMCEVTTSLALACQMRREEADKVKMTEQEMTKKIEGRRHALGKDVSSALEHLGKGLADMAVAQQNMIEIFNRTFTVALTGFADADLKGVNMLREEASNQTEAADDLIYKYLTGKQTIYDESAKRTASAESGLSWGVWGKLSGHNSTHRAHSNPDEKVARNEELDAAKAMAAANWRINLEDIRLNKVTAELKRFQFLKLLVDVKNRRDSELAEGTLSAALGIKACFEQSQDTIKAIIPALSRIADHQEGRRKSFYSHDIPLWHQREKCIVKVLSKCQTSSSNAHHAVRALANGRKEAIKHQVTRLDLIERKLRIWEMPTILANCCQYKRETPPGVLHEGWLLQKNTSRLSMQSWLRRWFILKKDGIFCLDLNSDQKERTEDSISKVKICDVVLSTVREIKDDVSGRFQFELIISGQKPLLLRAEGPHQRKEWFEAIKSAVETCLVAGDATSDALNQDIGKQDRRSTEIRMTVLQSKGPVMQELENLMEVMEEEEEGGDDDGGPEEFGEETCLSKVCAMNKNCADCGEPSPDWVSLNLGVLVCLECSGVHRSLGVHVSKVRSIRLDSLSTVESNLLLSLGNDRMNEIWEECLEEADALSPTADRKTRENWIRGKYIRKEYMKKENDFADVEVQSKRLYDAAKNVDVLGIVNALAKGAKIDWKNPAENGRSALHASALAKPPKGASDALIIEATELLIQNGAKLSYVDNDGDNVMEAALIYDSDPKMVEYLTAKSEFK